MATIKVAIAFFAGIAIGSIGIWCVIQKRIEKCKDSNLSNKIEHNETEHNKTEHNKIEQCKDVQELADWLDKRYAFHIERSGKLASFYKVIGCVFLITVPITSAFLSVLINDNGFLKKIGIPIDQPLATIYVSGFLSIVTIVNSIIKPSRNFNNSVGHCIELTNWKIKKDVIFIEILSKGEKVSDADYRKILDHNYKLSEIGKNMAKDLMSSETKR